MGLGRVFVNSKTHLGLIKILQQFALFFSQKIEKTAYTCNCKDAKHSNRHNLISVQDTGTIFACMIEFLGSVNAL